MALDKDSLIHSQKTMVISFKNLYPVSKKRDISFAMPGNWRSQRLNSFYKGPH